jgi:hypothetical protein
MKNKQKIIELAKSQEYTEHISGIQLWIGWCCVVFSLVFYLSPNFDFWGSVFLFVFGVICLKLHYYGKKELIRINKKLQRLK